MSYLDTFLQSRGYENTWRPDFMNVSATTQRIPVASGESGTIATHLEDLTIDRVILPNESGQHIIKQMIGLEGTATQVFETTIKTQAHTEDSISVDKTPDILAGDRLIAGGVTYLVKFASKVTTPSFGDVLQIYMVESKRG